MAHAQQGQAPASDAQLPPVEVIQQQAPPPQSPPPQTQAQPQPQSPPPVQQAQPSSPPSSQQAQTPPPQDTFFDGPDVAETTPPTVGRAGPDGRIPSSAKPVTSPINATGLLPADIQNFAGAATRVDRARLDEDRAVTIHDALTSVPGVVTVTDDGLARHVGIGIRGSNFRRARKVLVMEDGVSINFNSYIDPSTHYTPPLDRIENIEVLRGTTVVHGPLNNHGVVNFQNLSPFGETETIVSGAISYAEESLREFGNQRHVHTRQNLGNFGAVASYTGADGSGAWDNERLRFNDFYGALGWRDLKQDLTISALYFRQRDDYDEDNFVGTYADFFANGWDKTGAQDDDRTIFNTYNADHYAVQLAYNYYFDADTTFSTRAYWRQHERNRFSSREDPLDEGGWMRGRNRTYEIMGTDSRLEFANRELMGLIYDVQMGARYEHQKFRNCTSFGLVGERLDAENTGNCRATEPTFPDEGEIDEFEANAFSAFLQTPLHLTRTLTVTPGVRFEHYEVEGANVFPPGGDNASSEHTHVLPGIGLAWEMLPRTTLYAGYHRGFAPHVVRDVDLDDWPLLEEIGDNFQVGVRGSAMPGFTFDVAYFHSVIDNYQIREAYTDARGENIYGSLDEVQFNGVELALRAESRPVTGGPWNLFGEAVYTYTNSEILKGQDALFEDLPLTDVSGNRVPFVLEHFASLTVGLAYERKWDASMTWTYRGDFFSNPQNSLSPVCLTEDEDIDIGCTDDDLDEFLAGPVDSVWLLSARTNYHVNDKLSLFLSGHNLTNELYVADVSDGLKPGQGRTFLGGFKLKLE